MISCWRLLLGDFDWDSMNDIGRVEAGVWIRIEALRFHCVTRRRSGGGLCGGRAADGPPQGARDPQQGEVHRDLSRVGSRAQEPALPLAEEWKDNPLAQGELQGDGRL